MDDYHVANRFRVLIMGKANAGKTTILDKMCGSTDVPTVRNEHGKRVRCPIRHYDK